MEQGLHSAENDCIIRARLRQANHEFLLIFESKVLTRFARPIMYDPLLHLPLRQKISSASLAQSNGAFTPFQFRFHANLSRIHQLFFQLYGNRDDCEAEFWKLVDELTEMFEDRPDELKKLDLEREKDPFWLMSEKWVGMMLYVDRFAGDLNGMLDKVSYLEELGVNWVHLMPLLKSPPGSNDGGYAVSDYRDVDPRFGSMEDLKTVLAQLRKRGMLSTMDLVMNHTSDQHEWAQKARAGDQKYKNYYYFYPDRYIPDQYEHKMPEVFPHSSPGNFTYVEELQEHVMSVFHNYQWDLNYTNPEVFREMLKVLLFLANLGIDILRLDAVAFTWKQIGTTSQNLPQAHTILQLMKACAQVVAPGTAFIAEAIVAPREVVKYFGEGEAWGKECEIAYHATFMALLWDAMATGEVPLLTKGLRGIPGKPDRTTWINYLRCHDDIGLGFEEAHLYEYGKDPYSHKQFLINYYSGNFPGSLAKGAPFASNPKTGDARISGSMAALTGLEKAIEIGDQHLIDISIQKILMAHAIIFSFGGLPLLYYGDEIGTGNNEEYLNDPDQSYDNRWMHRPIIKWEKAQKRREKGSVEQRIFDGLKVLIHLRKASPEFADRNSCSLEETGNPHVLGFLRWNEEGARTIVFANFSQLDQAVHTNVLSNCGLAAGSLVDKISGESPDVAGDLFFVPAFSTFWLTEPTTFSAFQLAKEVETIQNQGLWPG